MAVTAKPHRSPDALSSRTALPARGLPGRLQPPGFEHPGQSAKRRQASERRDTRCRQYPHRRFSWGCGGTLSEFFPSIELEIDAGYIRAVPDRDGARWIAEIVPKLVCPVARHGYVQAHASSFNPYQEIRQQAYLASLGVPEHAPITSLFDGGEDVASACPLRCPSEQAFDWFRKLEDLATVGQ